MVSPTKAVLLFAALMSTAPSAEGAAFGAGARDRSRARETDRLKALIAPLVKPVLEAPNPLELEAAIEDQVLSGVLADVVSQSMSMLMDRPPPSRDVQARFVESIASLDIDGVRASHALELSMLSNQIARELIASVSDDERAMLQDEGGQTIRLEIEDLLYDVDLPVEVREAAHADLKSAICMLSIVYAAEQVPGTPKWLLEELVERWISGQRKSLPLAWAYLDEIGEISEDSKVALDRVLEEGAISVVDIDEIRRRAREVGDALRAIAEHAQRQPDGGWPPAS